MWPKVRISRTRPQESESSQLAPLIRPIARSHYRTQQAREVNHQYLADEIIGHSISRLLPVGDPDELTLMAEPVRRGETIEDFETRSIRQDSRTLEVSLTLSPIRDETGRVVGVLCLGVDVSERNRLIRAE